ncbi:MAG: hypothetical protein ACRCT8_06680 [Lacipirellulaceae bacterium]
MPAAPAPNDSAAIWRKFFHEWPEGILKRGVVVNRNDEQMPFKAYMLRGEVVLLERTNPDALGARYLIVPFTEIGFVKLVDPLRQDVLEAAGFRGKLAV